MSADPGSARVGKETPAARPEARRDRSARTRPRTKTTRLESTQQRTFGARLYPRAAAGRRNDGASGYFATGAFFEVSAGEVSSKVALRLAFTSLCGLVKSLLNCCMARRSLTLAPMLSCTIRHSLANAAARTSHWRFARSPSDWFACVKALIISAVGAAESTGIRN